LRGFANAKVDLFRRRIIAGLSVGVMWLSPLYLILIPVSLSYFFGINWGLSIVFAVLLYVTILVELLYQRWAIRFLEAGPITHEQRDRAT
jgi:hypothetical protein